MRRVSRQINCGKDVFFLAVTPACIKSEGSLFCRVQGAEPLWSGDSGEMELSSAFGYGCCAIQDERGGDLCPGYAELGGCNIPCMAGDLLQHILANEQLHLSPSWYAKSLGASGLCPFWWTGTACVHAHVQFQFVCMQACTLCMLPAGDSIRWAGRTPPDI